MSHVGRCRAHASREFRPLQRQSAPAGELLPRPCPRRSLLYLLLDMELQFLVDLALFSAEKKKRSRVAHSRSLSKIMAPRFLPG